MDNKRVAIQGIIGSYHHRAACEYYGGTVDIICCNSFDELADKLHTKAVDEAVMALENSIAGAIIPNYAFIDKFGFHITGEHYIRIEHHLLAKKGTSIEDITEVCSHPMALLQCKAFFKRHPNIKLVETFDTAAEAKRISEQNLPNNAAIAGSSCEVLYRLDSLAKGIQTIQNNTTRFVVLSNDPVSLVLEDINRASIKLTLNHKRGSLANILNVMSDYCMNLTKIQSLPIVESPWQYDFFIDVTFVDYADFDKAKSILTIMTEEFKILGEYKNNKPL